MESTTQSRSQPKQHHVEMDKGGEAGSMPKTAIVIGAGAGGIALAARLAKAGLRVTVFEKNDFTGGRCSLIRTAEGFRFDQGPSLLLLPELFEETFADLGGPWPLPKPGAQEDDADEQADDYYAAGPALKQAGVRLLPCRPNYRIWFSDRTCFRASTDTSDMAAQIREVEGSEGVVRYFRWLAEAGEHYALSVRHVLHRNFSGVLELAHPRFLVPALRLHALETNWGRARRYFWSERLRRVFTFATMYMGMSPFEAPATYSLLQFAELVGGVWYPKGGFHTVLERLVGLGERLGVQYRMGTAVEQVLVDEDSATAKGVRLAGGEEVAADVVVINADLVWSYAHLLPHTVAGVADYAKRLAAKETSCSAISFYWSLRRKVPALGVHNIFLADEFADSFDAIFKRHSLPDQPSFYVHVPSRIDPSAAPAGCDAVIVLVPVGHMDESGRQDWGATVARARAAVLKTVPERIGCEPIEPLIMDETVNAPDTWRAKFNLDRGAILGLSHDFFSVLAYRPPTRAVGVGRCYFVGASTHPGTGVPIVLAGAKITAEQILGHLGVDQVPWTTNAQMQAAEADANRGLFGRRGRSSPLDLVRVPPIMSAWNLGATLLLALVQVFFVHSQFWTLAVTFPVASILLVIFA